MKKIAVIILLPVLLAVGAFVVMNFTGQRESTSYRVMSSPVYEADWVAVPSVPISDSPEFRAFVARIPATDEASLTAEQRAGLNYTLASFVLCNHLDDYDLFREFRFGFKGVFNTNLIRFVAQQLHQKGITGVESPAEILELEWANLVIPERVSRSGQWTHIASEKHSKVACREWEHAPPPLSEIASFHPNARILTVHPLYIATPAPQHVLKTHGKVLIADFSTIVKQLNGSAGPVYFRCYWDPGEAVWLPWELVVAGTYNFMPPHY